MSALRVWVLRLTSIFGRARRERELTEELEAHVQLETDELTQSGIAPAEARRMALAHGGGVSEVHDAYRDQRGVPFIEQFVQDVRCGARTLRRSPGFTTVILVMLALGIGANTTIFTLVDAVVVRALPVSHPDQLVAIGDPRRVSSFSRGGPGLDLLSYPLYKDLRDHTKSFGGVLASGLTGRLDAHIGSADAALEHPHGRFVSANYFGVLGVPAARGRLFDGSEDLSEGASPVAVISYGYWAGRFHNDPAIVGSTVVIDDNRFTIIGIAREFFAGEIVGAETDIWLPASMHDVMLPHLRALSDRNSNWLLVLGRRKPNVTFEQARQETSALLVQTIVNTTPGSAGQAFLASKPEAFIASGDRGFSRVRATFETPLFTLLIGVGLLLCIICANIANLLLARAVVRGREMAVRLALGASRMRLVRQLLTESVLLAVAGSAAGMLFAWWGSRALLAFAFDGSAIPLDLSLDVRVMGFTLAVSFVAVLLFGLVPALRASRVELASSMRAGASAVAGSALDARGKRAPLGKLLVAAQVALSVTLLVGAAMLVRSLRNVQSTDVGLDRDHLLTLNVDVSTRGYTGARLAALTEEMRNRLAAIAGVDAVTYSANGIFSGIEGIASFELPGLVVRNADDSTMAYDQVGQDYVKGIGGHLVAGRDMQPADNISFTRVALVSESFAKRAFANESPVGKFIHIQDTIPVQIVGVLADTRDHALKDSPMVRVYFNYSQRNGAIGAPGSLEWMIRTKGDPAAVAEQVRKTIVAIDPALPIDGITPIVKLMQQSIREERLVAKLASAFGVLALLLASIGLYGIMSYAITRRTREIGLRVALGAQQADVVREILFESLRLVAAGIIVGIPVALGATRLLRTQLTGVGTIDVPSIAAALGVLAISGLVASLLPALRASRVSPIVALRSD
jgi:putative ABC transport system permease protein